MTAGNISIIQGEDFILRLTFKNTDGTAFDLTGSYVDLQVRRDARSTPIVSKRITTFSDAHGGRCEVLMSNVDTNIDIRAWRWQVKLTNPLGNERVSRYHTWRITRVEETSITGEMLLGHDPLTVVISHVESLAVTARYGSSRYNIDNSFRYA